MSRRARAALVVALACALPGCFAIQITAAPPEPPPPPVPDRFTGTAKPALVASSVPNCQAAPSLDPNTYYCADEHWYRFALNRWFLAFTWDGNWFPLGRDDELPEGLAVLAPSPEVVKKTAEERLEELNKKLEELDQQQSP